MRDGDHVTDLFFYYRAEDCIRDTELLLDFRRVFFRSPSDVPFLSFSRPFPVLLPSFCRPFAVLLPPFGRPFAVLLPSFSCPFAVLLLSFYRPFAVLLPPFCCPFAILLPSFCHPFSVLLPSFSPPRPFLVLLPISQEHTSDLPSPFRISFSVFCLETNPHTHPHITQSCSVK